jgi:hypothetical protein
MAMILLILVLGWARTGAVGPILCSRFQELPFLRSKLCQDAVRADKRLLVHAKSRASATEFTPTLH